jgi:D-beta-D-heptose 7-phosphate kinase/D-beta-D-heptose 1-phosphate adenosyltransferase
MNLPPIDRARAVTLVSRLAGRRVVVIGDLMLDRFVVGSVTRISPEAPVPVVRFESEYARLGGAANVAHNLAALGARATIIGVVGVDAAGAQLREQLAAAGLSTDGLVADPSRRTIEKVRIIAGRNQQVARVDYEDDRDLSESTEAAIVERIREAARHAEVLLVSDYLKGTVTRGVMQTLLEVRTPGTPLVVDPKIPHLDRYRGATLVTPNTHEAEIATHRLVRTDADAQAAARDFRSRAGCDAVLITRGEHGMWLSSGDVEGAAPATAREVADVTGAGDTVVATLSVALAAGASLAEATVLANHAAGIVVAKFGPATVAPRELLQEVGEVG